MGIFEVRLSCALQKGSVTVKNVGMNIDERKDGGLMQICDGMWERMCFAWE